MNAHVMKSPDFQLTAVIVLFFILKCAATVVYVDPSYTVADISYGFGDYVSSLLNAGEYKSCTSEGQCDYSTRMPFLPILYAALGLFSTSLVTAALIKNFLISLACLYFGRFLLREYVMQFGVIRHWAIVLIGLLLVFSPNVVKHAGNPNYEEGIIFEFLFVWAIAINLYAFRVVQKQTTDIRLKLICLFSAVVMFLTKSTMLFILLFTMLLMLIESLNVKRFHNIVLMILFSLPIGLWGAHNFAHSSKITFLTSWDGMNYYKGWNANTHALYPDVSLDRILDTDFVYKLDGSVFTIIKPTLVTPAQAADEWVLNESYIEEANDWILDNKMKVLSLFMKKSYYFLVSPIKTPISIDPDARDENANGSLTATISQLWTTLGRVAFVCLLGASAVYLWKGSPTLKMQVTLLSCTLIAYITPHLAGFNYERHVSGLLIVVFANLLVLTGIPKNFRKPAHDSNTLPEMPLDSFIMAEVEPIVHVEKHPAQQAS